MTFPHLQLDFLQDLLFVTNECNKYAKKELFYKAVEILIDSFPTSTRDKERAWHPAKTCRKKE